MDMQFPLHFAIALHTYATQLHNALYNKFRLLVVAGLLPGSIAGAKPLRKPVGR
jgi:hypothetical protein